jgi:hypothetical protein
VTQPAVEVLSGEGEIYAGDRLLRRTGYRLTIPGGDTAGRIEGDIRVATEGEAIILTRAERLTLLMDDGRSLIFSLADPSGRIRAHSGLEGIKASPR